VHLNTSKSSHHTAFQRTALATAITAALALPHAAFADHPNCLLEPSNKLLVNNLTDVQDPCDKSISIREAIQFANDNEQASNTITFAEGMTGTIEVNPALTITKNLTITGPGKDVLILQSNSNDLFTIDDPEAGTENGLDFDLSAVTLFGKDAEGERNRIIRHQGNHGGKITLDDIRVHEETKSGSLVYANAQDGESSISLTNSQINGVVCAGEECPEDKSIELDKVFVSYNPLGVSEVSLENTRISNIRSYRLTQVYGDEAIITINKSQIEDIQGFAKSGVFSAYSEQRSASIEVLDSNIIDSSFEYLPFMVETENGNANFYMKNSLLEGNVSQSFIYVMNRNNQGQNSFSMVNSSISENTFSYNVLNFPDTTKTQIINSSISHNILPDNFCCTSSERAVLIFRNGTANESIISNSTISNNAQRAISIEGHSENALIIENSTLSGNTSSANNGGGAIYLKGDEPEQPLSLNIINSTLSGNQSATAAGGAIRVENANISIAHSTIANNAAKDGAGGIYNQDGNVTISNSIIAANSILPNEAADPEASAEDAVLNADLVGSFTITSSLVQNLDNTETETETENGWSTKVNDVAIQLVDNALLGADPLLQDLTMKGGSTPVHDLAENSPARNAGQVDADLITEFDQRGEGFPRLTAEVLDLGAVQFHSNPTAVDDSATLESGAQPINIDVLANDASNSGDLALDLESVVIMEHPTSGEAEVQANGSLAFSLSDDFTGDVSIAYTVADIAGNRSNEATVNIKVTEKVIAPDPTPDPEPTPDSENKSSSKSSGGATYWLVLVLGMLGLRRFRK